CRNARGSSEAIFGAIVSTSLQGATAANLATAGGVLAGLHVGYLWSIKMDDTAQGTRADEFATPSDIQQSLHLPESQSLSNRRWMLSMESHVVCEGAQPNFVSGLAALFSTFYNFNLQYQEVAACTIELELFRDAF
ncbi:hypothetical protein DNTS_035755, partial [Danionella cerebrum]